MTLRVLRLPDTLNGEDQGELVHFGPDVNEAIELVRLRLNDYRRVKQPIQDAKDPQSTGKPAQLSQPPQDFHKVIESAEAYREALSCLDKMVHG